MSTNGTSGRALDAAVSLCRLGFSVIPVPFKEKGPKIPGWQRLRLAEADLPSRFQGESNIGVLLGEPSGWLVDVDLDHPLAVEAAREFLPHTKAIFGRKSRPFSHWLYRLESPQATIKWQSKKSGMIAELRSTGCQTIAPGSMHPDDEPVRWDVEGLPAVTAPGELVAAIEDLVRSVAPDALRGGGGMGDGERVGGMAMDSGMAEAIRVRKNPGGREGLSRNTLLFLVSGAVEGIRNQSLFAAACDYAGCGIPQSEAEHDLGMAGERCGLEPREVAAAIRSAYSTVRQPARLTASVTQRETQRNATPNAPPDEEPKVEPPAAPLRRYCLTNVTDAWREVPKVRRRGDQVERTTETEHFTIYKPIENIAAEIAGAANGWPKLVGGTPFFLRGTGLKASPIFMPQPNDLFGWLHREMDVRWTESACEDADSKAVRTPPTKGELLSALKQGAGGIDRFDLVTPYPHEPKMPRVFYTPLDLPPPTGEKLDEFLKALNAETETDRSLLLACMLTMLWGGQPGTRPVFVLTAASGVGAGKTATARAMADIVGGACSLDYNEKWTELSKQMMSSDEWNARVLLFDNVRGKFGGSALESVVTAKDLSGHRMYVGKVCRPNDATILVTFNLPELGRDMAERAVVINIGKPQHGKSFVAWAAGFVEEHRLQLLSDLLSILRKPPVVEINPEHGDRWQHWQREILGRIPNGDALAAAVCARRPAVDSDQDDAAAICAVLLGCLNGSGGSEVTTYAAHLAAVKASIWKNDISKADAANRQAFVGWMRRVLSGRGVIEPKMNEDGSHARRRVYDTAGQQLPGRSPIWVINVNAAGDMAGGVDEVTLPV